MKVMCVANTVMSINVLQYSNNTVCEILYTAKWYNEMSVLANVMCLNTLLM